MPGDSKECREHATRCAELVVEARTPQLRAMFLERSPRTGRKLQSNGKTPLPGLSKVTLLWQMLERPSMRINGFLTRPFGNHSPRHAKERECRCSSLP